MANIITRLLQGTGVLPRPKPMKEMGVSGTGIFGGWVQRLERNPQWVGQQKYRTSLDIATNVSIVAASLHHFLNLIAHPEWSVLPKDPESSESVDLAKFVEKVLFEELYTPWPRIVRRAGMYRFHGFGIQEWTAKKLDDGKIGFVDIESRPQFTIEQWVVSDDGTVEGCWQRSPQTGALLPLPRGKLVYLVEDTLTDSPEGLGLFRHLAEPYNRLRQYLDLETRGYERDLRGTPIGRAPLTKLRDDVKNGVLTQTEANAMIQSMQDFVKLQVKSSDTGFTIDSQPYESVSQDGPKIAGVPQWDLTLLQGGVAGLAELDVAVNRIQREMARILGTEALMMGDQGGNRALATDKSRNLYLVANAVLANIAAGFTRDLIDPLWDLNGFDVKLKPKFKTEDVAFKDALEVAQTLAQIASAGGVLAPDDEAINDVRDLLGISRAPEPSEEMMGAHYTPKEQQMDFSQREIDEGLAMPPEMGGKPGSSFGKSLVCAAYRKAWDESKHPRHPSGSEEGGQFRSATAPFITDFGEEKEVLNADTGERVMMLPRYGVWEYDRGRGKHQVTDTGNDLEALREKYGVPEDRVARMRKYDPNQPRHPKGSAEGGQWSGGVGDAWDDGKLELDELNQGQRDLLHRVVQTAWKQPRHPFDTHFTQDMLQSLIDDMGFDTEDGIKLSEVFKRLLFAKFDPNQPRAPKGSEEGGQWIAGFHITPESKKAKAWLKKTTALSSFKSMMAGTLAGASLYIAVDDTIKIIDHYLGLPNSQLTQAIIWTGLAGLAAKYGVTQKKLKASVVGVVDWLVDKRKSELAVAKADAVLSMLQRLRADLEAWDTELTKFDLNQPRAPKGTEEGGQWVESGAISATTHAKFKSWLNSTSALQTLEKVVVHAGVGLSLTSGVLYVTEVLLHLTHLESFGAAAALHWAIETIRDKIGVTQEAASRLLMSAVDDLTTLRVDELGSMTLTTDELLYVTKGTDPVLRALARLRRVLGLGEVVKYNPNQPRAQRGTSIGGQWVGFNYYLGQAKNNLFNTSRTVQTGVVNSGEQAGKESKIEDLSAAEIVQRSVENFDAAFRYAYGAPLPKTVEEVQAWGDEVNALLTYGIVKPGELHRTVDSNTLPYTRVHNLPFAWNQFGAELAARLSRPGADPVETSAWIEWRTRIDHFWTDGVGKTSRVLAAVPLMRAGLPLPVYPSNDEYYRHSPKQSIDPRDGGRAYLGIEWQNFLQSYRGWVADGYLRKYSPNQPRYPKGNPLGGQWRPEFGWDPAWQVQHPYGDATDLYERTAEHGLTEEEFLKRLTPEQLAALQEVEAELAKGVQTQTEYMSGGAYTPEREALHQQIIEDVLNPDAVAAATPAAGEQPTFVFTGGRTGAGKTTALQTFGLPFDQSKFLYLSADEIQEKLPGYTARLAGLFNAEGQDIAQQIETIARAARLNIIYDATMKSTGPAVARVRQLKDEGYKIEGYFVHAAPQVAAKRAVSRFYQGGEATGRYVPPRVSLNATTNEQTFDAVRPYLSKWALYDVNEDYNPKLVAHSENF